MKRERSMPQQQALARRRTELIIQVQNGLLSAQAAARQLAISRQTYYKWEQRALQAIVAALSNRRSGRPARPSEPEKAARKRQTAPPPRQLQGLAQIRQLAVPDGPPDKKKE